LSKSIATILWTKARHDFNAASVLVNLSPLEVGDQVFGLLLQQSIEKSVKALILAMKLRYDHTHDIEHLFHQLSKKIQVPSQFEELIEMTVFASKERYETPLSDRPIDRSVYLVNVQYFLEWIAETGGFE